MAPNRIPPPFPSSSDENEEQLVNSEGEAVEETSSADDDQEQEHEEDQEEEDDEEEEEEEESSDSESSESELGKSPPGSPNVSDFTIKPITSKPMVRESKKENAKKLNAAAPAPDAKRAGAKRVLDRIGSDDSNIKRCKVSNKNSENKEKKFGKFRLWSEDDEISILQGLIDFKLTKGVDPYADMNVFYEFEKERLSVSVGKRQLMDKIRRLKNKFVSNVEKSGEDADMGAFSKAHDVKCFELSKKIWGKGAEIIDDSRKSNNGRGKKSGGKVKDGRKVSVVEEKEKGTNEIKVACGNSANLYPYLNSAMEVQLETGPFQALSEEERRSMKEKIRGNNKAGELNEKFKILKMKEVQLYSEKLELMKETTGMFLGALKEE